MDQLSIPVTDFDQSVRTRPQEVKGLSIQSEVVASTGHTAFAPAARMTTWLPVLNPALLLSATEDLLTCYGTVFSTTTFVFTRGTGVKFITLFIIPALVQTTTFPYWDTLISTQDKPSIAVTAFFAGRLTFIRGWEAMTGHRTAISTEFIARIAGAGRTWKKQLNIVGIMYGLFDYALLNHSQQINKLFGLMQQAVFHKRLLILHPVWNMTF